MINDLQEEFAELIKQMTPLQHAETVLPIWEAEYPEEKAPRLVVEAAKKVREIVGGYGWRHSAACTSWSSAGVPDNSAIIAAKTVDSLITSHRFKDLSYWANHAFYHTTPDDLKRKVIETGKDILKRDEDNDPCS